ncbi:hypothetical protein [Shewanella algae]|uniref:hypothetical protein n=1 Tax=Shewanella algae TaxID=38313 RepID=UPI0031F4DD03
MRFLLLIVVLLNQFACVAIESKSTSDFFTPLIFSCLNAYAASGDGKDIEEVDRVYVVYVDSDEFVDVFFSHGDTGSFEDRKDDYKGILSCSGVLDDGFNIYRLRNPHMSEYFIDTPGVGNGVINVDTCGVAKERMYFFESGKVFYQGEKIFYCH